MFGGSSSEAFQWNIRLRECCRSGGATALSDLLLLYLRMLKHGVKPNKFTFSFLLKASANLSSLQLITALHAQIFKCGLYKDVSLATTLIHALSKFFEVESSRKVFEEMPDQKIDTPAWNSIISAYSRSGYLNASLSIFNEMRSRGASPNSLTLSILLQGCDGGIGRCLHGYICRQLSDSADVFLYNSLMYFYNKWGHIDASERLFKRMPERDLVSWNMMISGYTKNGLASEALEIFHLLREERISLDLVTLETALQACASLGDTAIKDGELIHEYIVQFGLLPNISIENRLLHMYCKCGQVAVAQSLFNSMGVRNLFSWNTMIEGYVQRFQPWKALQLFKSQRIFEKELSSDLIVSALQAVKLLEGKEELVMCIHTLSVITGFDSYPFINSCLISVYGESGNVMSARRCFDYYINERNNDRVSWNAMLSVYAHNWYSAEAIELLQKMQVRGCGFDSITLVSTLLVGTQQMELKLGKVVHGIVIRNAFELNVYVITALLELYSRCGLFGAACSIFSKMPKRSNVSWNTMIFCCSRNGFPKVSLNLFHLMQRDGLIPDVATVVGVIEAISQRGFEREAKYIHDCALRLGYDKDEFVANSLIAMYARFGDFDQVNLVFDRINKDRPVVWNAMIAEYSCHGLPDKAIALFHLMKIQSVGPDMITFLSLLPSCACFASLSCTLWIHSIIFKTGFESNVFVGSALLDTYAKSADMNMARLIFDQMNYKTIVTWNSMIWGYGMHGDAEQAGMLFSEMQELGVGPDIITFLALISTCGHIGDVEKGQKYFDLMTQHHSMSPGLEHYSCIVNLLSRKGLFHEAFEFIKKMEMGTGRSVWGSLLGACRIQGNLEVGLVAAQNLFQLDPTHCGYHVLIANMYSESGRWLDAATIRNRLEEMGIKKLPGWSKIETT